MTLPFNPVSGDVLTENNGTEWVIIDVFTESDTGSTFYWAKTTVDVPTQYTTITPSDQSKFTKKEPVFEVGKQYTRVDESDDTIYTVVLVDGLEVLVWWESLTGVRWASWILYEERKHFVEVGTLK